MYEKFKSELLCSLSEHFGRDDLQTIGQKLDIVGQNYTVNAAERSLMITGREEAIKLVKTYIVVRGIEGLSKTTLQSYTYHLMAFADRIRKPVAELTANDIRIYLYERQQTRGVTNRSLDSVRGCLATFFGWMTGEGYIPKNPMQTIKPIKYEKKPRQALSQLDLEYLRRGCRTARETAVIEVLYSTGCRVSELAGIKLSDIDWNSHSVQLFGKGNKYRTSYLNAKAEVAIREYLSVRKHDSIFLLVNDRGGGPMRKDNIEKMVRQIVQRSALAGREISPHVLRHTTATQAMRSGMPVQDIQKLLGHASIATTMIYASTSTEAVAAGHKKYVV